MLGASSPRGDKAAVSVVPLKAAENTTGEVLCSRLGDCCFIAVPSPLIERTCTPLSGPSDLSREEKGERESQSVSQSVTELDSQI